MQKIQVITEFGSVIFSVSSGLIYTETDFINKATANKLPTIIKIGKRSSFGRSLLSL